MEVKSYLNKMSAQFYAYYPVGHTCLTAGRFTADPPAGEAGTLREKHFVPKGGFALFFVPKWDKCLCGEIGVFRKW